MHASSALCINPWTSSCGPYVEKVKEHFFAKVARSSAACPQPALISFHPTRSVGRVPMRKPFIVANRVLVSGMRMWKQSSKMSVERSFRTSTSDTWILVQKYTVKHNYIMSVDYCITLAPKNHADLCIHGVQSENDWSLANICVQKSTRHWNIHVRPEPGWEIDTDILRLQGHLFPWQLHSAQHTTSRKSSRLMLVTGLAYHLLLKTREFCF